MPTRGPDRAVWLPFMRAHLRAVPILSNFLLRLCVTASELFGAQALTVTLNDGPFHTVLGLCDVNGNVHISTDVPLRLPAGKRVRLTFNDGCAGKWCVPVALNVEAEGEEAAPFAGRPADRLVPVVTKRERSAPFRIAVEFRRA